MHVPVERPLSLIPHRLLAYNTKRNAKRAAEWVFGKIPGVVACTCPHDNRKSLTHAFGGQDNLRVCVPIGAIGDPIPDREYQ